MCDTISLGLLASDTLLCPLPILLRRQRVLLSLVQALLFLYTGCCCCCCFYITYLSRKSLSSFAAQLNQRKMPSIIFSTYIYLCYTYTFNICARCHITKAHSGLVCSAHTHLLIHICARCTYIFLPSIHTVMGNWMVATVIAKQHSKYCKRKARTWEKGMAFPVALQDKRKLIGQMKWNGMKPNNKILKCSTIVSTSSDLFWHKWPLAIIWRQRRRRRKSGYTHRLCAAMKYDNQNHKYNSNNDVNTGTQRHRNKIDQKMRLMLSEDMG